MTHSIVLAPSEQPRPKRRRQSKRRIPTLNMRADGRWQKKVLGKIHYFSRGSEADALAEWERVKDDLLAGRTPPPKPVANDAEASPDQATVGCLVNAFLKFKRLRVESGELSQRTWDRYAVTGELVIATFGRNRPIGELQPDDFARLRNVLAKRYTPVVLNVEIQTVRSIMRYADELCDIDAIN
jgi:hypothetical protein